MPLLHGDYTMTRLPRPMGGRAGCCMMKASPCMWYSGLLVLLMLGVTLDTRQRGVAAEQVYHRRFHDDQALLNPPRRHFEVKTVDMALYYLQRYGYINITRCRQSVGESALDIHRRSAEEGTQGEPSTTDSLSTPPDRDLFTTAPSTSDDTTSGPGGVSSSMTTEAPHTSSSSQPRTEPTSRSIIMAALASDLGLSTTTETSAQIATRTTSSELSSMSSEGLTLATATMEPVSSETTEENDYVAIRASDPESAEEIALCHRDIVILGLRHYQKAYQLQQTGVVDDATIQSMNQRRCGNQDIYIEKTLEEEEEEEEEVPVPPQAPAPTRRKRRAREVLERRQELRSRVREAHGTPYRGGRGNVYLMEGIDTHALSLEIQDGEHDQVFGVSMARRRQQLEEIKNEIQHKDIRKTKTDSLLERSIAPTRRKRSNTAVTAGLGFNINADDCLTWRILDDGYSTKMPIDDQESALRLAFRMWSEVIPVNFCVEENGHIHGVDIEISFARGTHMDCNIPFDGDGGALAHSWSQGNIHFDEDEDYTRSVRNGHSGIVLPRVAVHEIGHVLGLHHVARLYSIMYSKYPNYTAPLELGWEDRKDAQAIYGCCKGSFNVIFDWIHRQGDGFVFNTYMFRRENYWMYENRYNRTRYGDPQRISHEWDPRLVSTDSYAQAFYPVPDKPHVSDAYFFKGNYYYQFDDESNRVMDGFPRKISDDWGPGPNATHSNHVPSNLDAAYFHPADKNMYFFKGNQVWVVDYVSWKTEDDYGCCDQIANFEDLFPAAPGRPDDPVLTGHVDTVYYARFNYKQYFFKGDEFWENAGLSRGLNILVYRGYWWNHWYDICEVL